MGAHQRVARPKAGWVRHSEVHGWIGAPIQALIQGRIHRASRHEGVGAGALPGACQGSVMILMEDCDPLAVVKSIWPQGRIEA